MRAWILAGALLAMCMPATTDASNDRLPAVAYPEIAHQAATPEGFVPHGWRLETMQRGRLDEDAHEDLLLLLRMDDPGNVIVNDGFGTDRLDTNPRMLVVALADPAGGWRRAMVDHALIPRAESATMEDFLDGDAASAITIHDNRSIGITLHSFASAGSWYMGNTTFTFRHQHGCFRLIGYDQMDVHRASLEMTESSVNYLTGQGWTAKGSASEDSRPAKQWQRLPRRKPICIEDVGDGFMFDPGLQ